MLGDRLAEKIGARVGSNVTLAAAGGVTMSATVVGLFHSGVRLMDETTGLRAASRPRRFSKSRPGS